MLTIIYERLKAIERQGTVDVSLGIDMNEMDYQRKLFPGGQQTKFSFSSKSR